MIPHEVNLCIGKGKQTTGMDKIRRLLRPTTLDGSIAARLEGQPLLDIVEDTLRKECSLLRIVPLDSEMKVIWARIVEFALEGVVLFKKKPTHFLELAKSSDSIPNAMDIDAPVDGKDEGTGTEGAEDVNGADSNVASTSLATNVSPKAFNKMVSPLLVYIMRMLAREHGDTQKKDESCDVARPDELPWQRVLRQDPFFAERTVTFVNQNPVHDLINSIAIWKIVGRTNGVIQSVSAELWSASAQSVSQLTKDAANEFQGLQIVIQHLLTKVCAAFPPGITCFADAVANPDSAFWRLADTVDERTDRIQLIKKFWPSPDVVDKFLSHRTLQIICLLVDVVDVLSASKGEEGFDRSVAASINVCVEFTKKFSSVARAMAQIDRRFLTVAQDEVSPWSEAWASIIIKCGSSDFAAQIQPKSELMLRSQANQMHLTDLRKRLGLKMRNPRGEGSSKKEDLVNDYVTKNREAKSPSPERLASLFSDFDQDSL